MNTEKKEINTEYIWRLKKNWEKNFPDLIGDWTHYQIKGDDKELAVVDGLNLIEALNIVEDNFGKYKLILVHRAKVGSKGKFLYEEYNNYHISKYDNDIGDLENFKRLHDSQNSQLNTSYTSKYKHLNANLKKHLSISIIRYMEKRIVLYRGITYLTMICFILLIFVQSKTETVENIIYLIRQFIFFTSFIFATLWIRRQVSLISLILFFVFFNLILLSNPLLFKIEYFSTYEFSKIRFVILIVSVIFMLIGFWYKCPIKYVRREFNLKDYTIYVPIIVLTILIQFILRLI